MVFTATHRSFFKQLQDPQAKAQLVEFDWQLTQLLQLAESTKLSFKRKEKAII